MRYTATSRSTAGPEHIRILNTNLAEQKIPSELTLKLLQERLQKTRELTQSYANEKERLEKSHRFEISAMNDELSSNFYCIFIYFRIK